jgi:two-component system, NtrC family, sensor kinase
VLLLNFATCGLHLAPLVLDLCLLVLLLTIIMGPDKGRTFQLPDSEPQLLGRSSEALPIADTTVSRRHAELTPDAGKWFVRDLGSQNGTFVNGVRLEPNARHELAPGDQIRVGSTLISFGKTINSGSSAVRLVPGSKLETNIERAIASNDDSVILALDPDLLGAPRATASGSVAGTMTSTGLSVQPSGTVFGVPTSPAGANAALRVLYRLIQLIGKTTEKQALLEEVMDVVMAELRPQRGCIMLIEPGSEPAPAVVRLPASPATKKQAAKDSAEPLVISKTILQHALEMAEGVLASNAMSDPRFRKGDSVHQLAIRSAICSPIKTADRTFGAIYIDSSIAATQYTPEHLALLNAIGQQTALALSNIELLKTRMHTERLAAMGETVASLSHSIKNILQGLRGGADVVEMGLRKDDLKVSRGGWPILKRNLDRIINLTMNMLAYSRPRTLEIELVKLAPLLDDCASLLADQCRLRGVVLLVDVDPEMPPVPVDSGQMHQAFLNLMSNAVEAVEPRIGVVTVRATFKPESGQESKVQQGQARGEARIDVIDNGAGIAPELQRSIFEPFFTTKGMRGTGLGLAVTKRIIDQHKGKISLKSVPGKGSTFSVAIPVDPGAMIDPSATTATKR